MENGTLDNLIRHFASLPGLGSRSAKRIALYLLTHKEDIMIPMARAIEETAQAIQTCNVCGNLDTLDPCSICRDTKRDDTVLCVVSGVADLWAMERTQAFKGRYHVLGGVLSAIDGITPNDLSIDSLIHRVKDNNIQEIILALSATVDGQSTAHYITDCLEGTDVKITRLAHGIPVGGELDYLDDTTIATALKSRANL